VRNRVSTIRLDIFETIQPHQVANSYPATIQEACAQIRMTVQEIDAYVHQEGHTPAHKEIPWRIAFVLFCIACALKAGMPQSEASGLLEQVLEEIGLGVTVDLAYQLLQAWYEHLCQRTPAVHVDQHVLVPIMLAHMKNTRS